MMDTERVAYLVRHYRESYLTSKNVLENPQWVRHMKQQCLFTEQDAIKSLDYCSEAINKLLTVFQAPPVQMRGSTRDFSRDPRNRTGFSIVVDPFKYTMNRKDGLQSNA